MAAAMEATWKDTLTRYQRHQSAMKRIYEDMVKTFEDVVKSKVLGENITIENLVTESERETIEKCLVIKPTIAFIGQVNAGKSSLANELLGGGTWLPVAPEPCTSRMVRLKYSSKAYKQKIPFDGKPEKRNKLKATRPTSEDIRLSDKEKKDPKVFEVEMLFGVPNLYLYPDLEIVDLPGWCEKESLNAVIGSAVDRISQATLVPIYVLDGNLTVSAVDREFIKLLLEKIQGNQILFVCNKIDHVEEEVQQNHGEGGQLEVLDDGTALYTIDDREVKLLNKKKATFESLKKFGFVNDSETASNSSSFYAVSARISKATRVNERTVQSKYCDCQDDQFRRHLNSRLSKVLTNHVLDIIRSTNIAVSRFAEGTLTARSAELTSDMRINEILRNAGKAEEDAYSKCLAFLANETKTIENVVLQAFDAAEQQIMKNARAITSKDIETDSAKVPFPVAFATAIAEMSARVIHGEISSRLEKVKEEYVQHFSLLMQVIFGSCSGFLSGLFQSIVHSSHSNFSISLQIQVSEDDEAMQAALGLLSLIPEAVKLAIREAVSIESLISKSLTQIAGVALGIVRLDAKWRESVAKEYLSLFDVRALAPAIVKHFAQTLEERHASFVQSHKRTMQLREAASRRNEEGNLMLRKEFSPRIAMLLLRLYALQCVVEKDDPQEGEKLAEGNHSKVSSCTAWGSLKKTDKLVVKKSFSLSQTAWKQVAKSFFVLRTIHGNEEIQKHIVKLHGVQICPLDASEEERLVLVLEKRARTLPDALRQGLSRQKRKLIAFDLAQALSFLHNEDIVHENLTSDAVSLDWEDRAKIDLMKLSTSLFEDSWLGCPAFHQSPEVFVNEDSTSPATDVYSFGMILWELFNESIQPPACYADCSSTADMKRKVYDEGLRPSKPNNLEDEWYSIMQECWKESGDRPTMDDLSSRIKELVASTDSQTE